MPLRFKIENRIQFSKEIPLKKIAFNFIWKIPCNFFKKSQVWDHFWKSRCSRVILKIVGATPLLVQNIKPIGKLFCTFYTNFVITQETPFNISKKKLNDPKWITFFLTFFTFSLSLSLTMKSPSILYGKSFQKNSPSIL